MAKAISITFVLEQHTAKLSSDGRFPVSLRVYDPVTQKGKRYRTGNFALHEELEEVTASLKGVEKRAKDICELMRLNNQTFNFNAFERQLKNAGGNVTLYKCLEDSAASQALPANRRAIEDLLSILRT